jgi:hypothetical protein
LNPGAVTLRAALTLVALVVSLALANAAAAAPGPRADTTTAAAGARTPLARHPRDPGAPASADSGARARLGTPASQAPSGEGGAGGEGEVGALEAPPREGDVLAENGLGSPACRAGTEAQGPARENCVTSGFAPAPAPTGNYAFDVHIDTGLAHFSNYLEAAVQDAAQWGWMALVALVRALLVMLEWCYSLNLLGGALLGQVASALRRAQATFTTPGLAIVMTVASVLAVYHGLIRRRVAQTLGEVLAMMAMMVAGLWAIADPVGSVGTLSDWVNRASIGVLGAVAAGSPGHPDRTFARDMQGLFADVITAPWCYMEFGNVRWCRDPRLLDERLRRAALRIASEDRSLAAGSYAAGSEHHALLGAASMLEGARENGELFLALPANGVARNSINEGGSLLSVLCGGSKQATQCAGPTASEADFRTQHGTWPRVVGLVMIWLGALTMLVLFGWIGSRLLAAAVLSLFLLLLAPAAILAPALGDGGRGLFRAWATRLLGAITAKLLYSVLLGATLLMSNLLAALSTLGWWVQWVLVSAGWWLAFHERHALLSAARVGEATPWATSRGDTTTAPGRGAARGLRRARGRAVDRTTDALLTGAGRWVRRTMVPAPPVAERRPQVAARQTRARARALADEQVVAMLEQDRREASARVEQAPAMQAAVSAMRTQLARIQVARDHAETPDHTERERPGVSADARRAARLAARAQRVEAAIAREQDALVAARQFVAEGQHSRERDGAPFSEAQLGERARLLDEQAALPHKGRANVRGERRDYRRLAALAGEHEREWHELGGERRHRAMLRIDDELFRRAGLEDAARRVTGASERAPGGRRRWEDANRRFGREISRRGHPMPPPERRSKLVAWLEEERERERLGRAPPTLAERAKAAAGEPSSRRVDASQRLQRLRRQFGRQDSDLGHAE